MKISELTADTRTADIEIPKLGSLKVKYCPGLYTPETEDRLQSAIESARPAKGISEVLIDVVLEWDLMDAKDKMIPITQEALMKLPSSFLVAVSNGITRDMGVSAEERKNSGGGSLQAE